ncbi:peptidase M56 [Massilia sp. Root418]|jgi:D-alanyl-D-alanine endopeptidase (penicillin-binding protein 7)|uniref:M56 family metallopeptidase n=1 Tax=Massilia sp. Root418 TaxID=1736532 RepID=UPI0006F8419A|nr:M56 family metallopeptidase [Massilia sp. Root418]KQW87912.1 peptidase M56 [Massilia sp. Root418]
MSAAINALAWTLLHFIWQGAVIGMGAALTLALMRRATPGQRYMVACTALALCLGWPALELAQRLSAADAGGAALRLPGLVAAEGMDDASLLPQQLLQVLQVLAAHARTLVVFWAACVTALSLRAAAGILWISRSARHGGTDTAWQERLSQLARRFGIRRAVRLRVTASLASPVTAGWWRPVVLVPAALLARMPPELLEALLAHELAHVRRHDYLINLLQNAVETLLFFHPAVWWISSRIRTERELIADHIAASTLGEPRRLALALSELERLQFSTQHLAIAANGGDLMVRIKHLVQPRARSTGWKAVIPALVLAAAGIGVLANASAGSKAAPQDTHAVMVFDHCKKPDWPAGSKAAKEQGTVTLEFGVSADGKVTGSSVKKSSGYAALDEAAREGLKQCAFKPAIKGGKPISSNMQMQYVWVPD